MGWIASPGGSVYDASTHAMGKQVAEAFYQSNANPLDPGNAGSPDVMDEAIFQEPSAAAAKVVVTHVLLYEFGKAGDTGWSPMGFGYVPSDQVEAFTCNPLGIPAARTDFVVVRDGARVAVFEFDGPNVTQQVHAVLSVTN